MLPLVSLRIVRDDVVRRLVVQSRPV